MLGKQVQAEVHPANNGLVCLGVNPIVQLVQTGADAWDAIGSAQRQ